MSFSTTYLLNVALHAAALSVVASVVHAFMRLPSFRSMTAIAGLLAVGTLPWFTALRVASPRVETIATAPASNPVLPVWTIVKMEAPAMDPPPIPVPTTAVAESISHSVPPVEKFRWPDLPATLLVLWATGVVICLSRLALAWLGVRSWRKRLQPIDDSTWKDISRHTGREVPREAFLIDPERTSPCVMGWWQTRIVVPAFLLEAKSQRELGWAVRHEVGHWQSGDSRWMILFSLIRGVNWWNPFVRHLLVRWEEAREQICDLRASKAGDHRAEYGEFLIAMSRALPRKTPLAVAMAKRTGGQLGKRIRFLLGALAGADRPVGKLRAGLVCGWLAAAAVLISGVRIHADEAATSKMKVEISSMNPDRPGETPVEGSAVETVLSNASEDKEFSRVRITTEYVLSAAKPDEAEDPESPMNPEEASKWIKERKYHLSAASVEFQETATHGQEARLGYYWPLAGMRAKDTPQTPFLGVKLRLTPDIGPDDVGIRISSDYRHMPGITETLERIWSSRPERMDLPPGLNPEKVVVQKKDKSFRLRPGQKAATKLGLDGQGRILWLVTSAETMDTLTNRTPTSLPFPGQISYSTKFILAKETGFHTQADDSDPSNGLAGLFSDNQVQLIMRGLAQRKGTNLMTAPSLTARPGQQALMELIREVAGSPDQIARRAKDSPVPFVGIRTRFNGSLEDAPPFNSENLVPVLNLGLEMEYRYIPNGFHTLLNSNVGPPANADPDRIKTVKKAVQISIPAGYTLAVDFGQIEPDLQLLALVTANLIDATGRPFVAKPDLQGSKFTDATPSPQTEGKLRLSGTVVDIPSKGGTVAGSSPAYENVADAIRNIPGAKIQSLPAVEIPVFTHVIPWPEMRELKVSGIISKDFSRITFARWSFQENGDFPETWQDLPAGTMMNLNIGSADPSIDRRLLVRIEPVK